MLKGHVNVAAHPVEAVKPVLSPDALAQLIRAAAEVHVSDDILGYSAAIAEVTRSDARLRLGVSPRGTIALTHAAQARGSSTDATSRSGDGQSDGGPSARAPRDFAPRQETGERAAERVVAELVAVLPRHFAEELRNPALLWTGRALRTRMFTLVAVGQPDGSGGVLALVLVAVFLYALRRGLRCAPSPSRRGTVAYLFAWNRGVPFLYACSAACYALVVYRTCCRAGAAPGAGPHNCPSSIVQGETAQLAIAVTNPSATASACSSSKSRSQAP